MSQRHYRDTSLNRLATDTLKAVWAGAVLVGLQIGRLFIPRPVVGLEHEYNTCLRLEDGDQRTPDQVAVEALLRVAQDLEARPARGRLSSHADGFYDSGRLIAQGPGGMPVHEYSDAWKFETSYGEFTSSYHALAFKEAYNNRLRELVCRAASHVKETGLLLHLSGGDGTSTCASAHLNIPWADSVAHAAYRSLEAYDHLQQTLVRQLAIMTSVCATGMPCEDGLLTDPRSRTFSQIIGMSTLEPHRAMQLNRLQARPAEGFDRKGVGRNMQMLAIWGQSQVANFLMLTLNQMETLRLHLNVAGLHTSPEILPAGENLLTLAVILSSDRKQAGGLTRAALEDYVRIAAFLTSELGEVVMEQLVPDHQAAFALTDRVLTAIEKDDEETLIKATDMSKKAFLIDQFLSNRPGSWRDNLSGLLNICFVFASPQEISPYYTFFRKNDLEMQILQEEDITNAGPDLLTRSFFFTEVLRRFGDELNLSFNWDRLTLRKSSTVVGGWVPQIQFDEKTILLPSPMGHNSQELGNLFDTHVTSVEDLFEIFGTSN